MTMIPTPLPKEDFVAAEPASEGFSLRARMIELGVDPRDHLRIAHTMLTSGFKLDIKRYNPCFPTSGVYEG